MKSIDEKFFSKIEKIPFHECWEWVRAKNQYGYGVLRISGRNVLAHRLSFMHHRGPIEKTDCVLHRCDNPGCVNPRHLFLGSKKDNSQDMSRKGRGRSNPWNTKKDRKLSPNQVIEIREKKQKGVSAPQLSKEYGVCTSTIFTIVHRKKWKHI